VGVVSLPRGLPPRRPCCWCWCGVVAVPASGVGPSSYGLGAPAIHPTSSCSSAWGGCSVVHRPCHPIVVRLPVVPVVIVVLYSPSPSLSPPLSLSSAAAARSWPGARQCRRWLLTPTIHPASSCSQAWGRVLGRPSWLGCSVAFFCWWRWCCGCGRLSSFHPQYTPRAVARGAGGGWCVVRRRGWLWWGPGTCFRHRHLFWGGLGRSA
jgi:hypothetical protein